MKRHSTSLVGKTQFKITIKYHYIPARGLKKKKSGRRDKKKILGVGKNMKNPELSFSTGKGVSIIIKEHMYAL